MIISEEEAAQFAVDLLASTLPMMSTQENTLVPPSNVAGAANVPAFNSPDFTVELPLTSGTGALLDTAIVPPSSATTGLLSTGKIQLISLSSLSFFILCSSNLTSFLPSGG